MGPPSYKSFNDELDKDFHDYEDEETSSGETGKGTSSCDAAKERTYITLEPGKCKAGEEKNAEGPKDAEPAPETAPQDQPLWKKIRTVPENDPEPSTLH